MRLVLLSVIGVACSSPAAPVKEAPPLDAGSGSAVVVTPAPPLVAPGKRLPESATPLAYDLRLEIDPDRPRFRGTVAIRVQLARPTDHVWLHAEQLVIERASFTSASAKGTLKDLAIDNPDDMRGFAFGTRVEGEVTLVFAYTGTIVDDEPEGLFRQKAGGRWYVYAQSESVFARRITPSFDEPRWKPRWKVTIAVPARHVAAGNGAVVHETVAAGTRTVELAEVPSMASYLLAIAVGPFQVVAVPPIGRGKIPTRVIVPAPDAGRTGVVRAKLPAVVDALERYLDRPLPLAKLDLVAVPEFFGAMENTGLITFEASLLVGDPNSGGLPRRFVRFAAHELAHQWFGNQVTQAWWDDLWLAEGFSTWLGDRIADELGAYADPALRRQLARLDALEADDDATPRPLRRPTGSDSVEDRFDAIAYEKGGALLEMFEEFVGAEPFQRAIRAYVARHDGRHVTSSDFVRALGETSPGAAAALTTYLDLGGAPVVTLAVACTGTPAIEVRAATGTVPVCVRYPDGAKLERACVAATPTQGTIALASCPAWVIGNAGGDGYYRIANPALAAKAPVTPSERLAYADDLGAGLLRGDVPLATALAEIDRLARSRDATSALSAAIIAQAIRPLILDDERAAWTAWLTPRFASWAKLRGSSGVDLALVRDVMQLLPPRGPGKPWLDKLVARAKAAPDDKRAELLDALGGIAPEHAAEVVELGFSGAFRVEQVLPAITTLLARPTARTRTWNALRPHLAAISKDKLGEVAAATAALCEAEARAEVVAAFTGTVPADQLAKPLAAIDRCLLRRSKLGDLAGALKPR